MSLEELYSIYRSVGCKVSTDSRNIPEGAIFFALRGENFDGNDYALKALEAGASYAVVNDDACLTAGANTIDRLVAVPDPFKTMQALAVLHRETLDIPVIGLTGTNGKTTTKELITAALATKYRVSSTKGNLNNDIGVPLTLLSIPVDAQIAVVEMGANHPDDIAKLVKVSRPDYGYITNVGTAHLLGFGSYEGVLKAKTELYRWLGSHPGSVIFVNRQHADLAHEADRQACHKWEFSFESMDAEILPCGANNPFLSMKVGNKEVHTRLVGAYNAENVLAALAISEYFGVNRDAAIAAIEAYTPSNNRSQLMKTERNTLIIDAYNANPSSMHKAIENLASLQGDRKIAMLGDMRELGSASLDEHVGIVKMLMDNSLPAYLVGDEFGHALASLSITPGEDSIIRGHFASSEALSAYISARPELFTNEFILVKGSRGIKMENVLAAL